MISVDVLSAAHSCRGYPRWEPYAGKLHVRILCGGCEVTRIPTAPDNREDCLLRCISPVMGRSELATSRRVSPVSNENRS